MKNKRRFFFKQGLSIGAAVVFTPEFLFATRENKKAKPDNPGFTVLFQGDSITDGNRSRNDDWNHVMGHGYQYIISSRLWYEQPDKQFHFFNRGISGNKVTDLQARWQKDTLDLKPDLLSILIGINDTSAFVYGTTGFSAQQYENDYRSMIARTKDVLPDTILVLCEPFVLKVGARVTEKWETYYSEIQKRQQVVRRLSKEFRSIFVPFQQAFNNALEKAPAEYWIWDGIHPMPAGHELMALEWIKTVGREIKFIR